jgi:hypothetical protein
MLKLIGTNNAEILLKNSKTIGIIELKNAQYLFPTALCEISKNALSLTFNFDRGGAITGGVSKTCCCEKLGISTGGVEKLEAATGGVENAATGGVENAATGGVEILDSATGGVATGGVEILDSATGGVATGGVEILVAAWIAA